MARNEKTSSELASLAARALRGEKLTPEEVKRLAGSVLTQTEDKPKPQRKPLTK